MNQAFHDWLDGTRPEPPDQSDQPPPVKVAAELAELLVVQALLCDLGSDNREADERRIQNVLAAIDAAQRPVVTDRPTPSRRTRLVALLSLVGCAALLGMLLMLHQPTPISAASVLETLTHDAAQEVDRTYRVRVVEEYPPDKRPRHLPPERGNRGDREEIDGAVLHVRGPDKYVLIRSLHDGQRRLTGSDGVQGWAFRESGPIHVSSDPTRFQGGVPGQQQDFPFINIRSHLEQLREGYELELPAHDATADGTNLAKLIGTRKSRDVRGPKRVEIWFDPETGTIQRMLLDGLPRGKGGPKSVLLELTEQRDLGPQFFSHTFHHEPGRQVRHEED